MDNKSIICDFKKHLLTITDKKLHNVQTIVQFYFWFKKLDKKYEPFKRHVRAAKKIDVWAKSDLDKAYNLIIDLGVFMDNKGLDYTLDTIHRNIPKYESGSLDNDEVQELKDALEFERKRTEQRLAEFRKEQKEEKRVNGRKNN